MAKTQSYYDVSDALAQPGCPICNLTLAATARLLDALLYENVNDVGFREKLRRARGLCNPHLWALVRKGAAQSLAILTHDVLREVLRNLSDVPVPGGSVTPMALVRDVLGPKQPHAEAALLAEHLAPQSMCPVCTRAREAEDDYLAAFTENLLGRGGLLAAYRTSDGLCLLHLRRALEFTYSARTYAALVQAQQAIWTRLERQLDTLIQKLARKPDPRYRDELIGEEADSWRRAIVAVAGERVQFRLPGSASAAPPASD